MVILLLVLLFDLVMYVICQILRSVLEKNKAFCVALFVICGVDGG